VYAKSDCFLVSVTWKNTKNGLVNSFTKITGISVGNMPIQFFYDQIPVF
jgi:hypothetical protein